jgi:hypothetical protein
MTFKETEKFLQGRFLLKFKNLDVAKEATIEEFINNFFIYSNYETIFAARSDNPKRKGLKTVNGKLQTDGGRRRSLGDIFRICRYYFPDVTLEQVFDCLCNRIIEKTSNTSFCNQTKRRMYYSTEKGYGGNIYNKDTSDEFGMVWNDYPIK